MGRRKGEKNCQRGDQFVKKVEDQESDKGKKSAKLVRFGFWVMDGYERAGNRANRMTLSSKGIDKLTAEKVIRRRNRSFSEADMSTHDSHRT